ncbi:MAG: hypothetical protein HUU28_17515 [Planctomycetaceae bacterium]|jgi:hypothetical protein|nr:hypothetical protein [Planctomycetaceae bacterium]
MTEWKFTKRQPACRHCQRTFEDTEPHISALAVRGEEVAREDVCLACWKTQVSRGDLFWWRTRHEEGKKRGIALNLEALEALFTRLEGQAAGALAELRYVLCLVLMRKRKLKIERVERDADGEALIVSRPRRSELYRVAVFDFSPEKIDELRTRLQEVFEGAEAAEIDPDAKVGAQDGDDAAADDELGEEAGATSAAVPGE